MQAVLVVLVFLLVVMEVLNKQEKATTKVRHWNWFRKVPQKPVGDPDLQRLLDQQRRGGRTRESERQANRQSMYTGMGCLGFAVFSILLLVIAVAARDAIGPFYGEVVVAIGAVVVVVFWVAVAVAARGQQLAARRLFCIGGAIICAASGWYVLPTTQGHRLSWAAVESASKRDWVRASNPEPTRLSTKRWVLAHENEAALWKLKYELWVQENTLRRPDSLAHGAVASVCLWGIAALFVICAVAPKTFGYCMHLLFVDSEHLSAGGTMLSPQGLAMAFVNAAGDYLVVLDRENRLVFANKAFRNTFLAGKEPNGLRFFSLVDSSSAPRGLQALGELDAGSRQVELFHYTSEEKVQPVQYLFCRMDIEDTQLVAGIGRDKTSELELLGEITQLNIALEEKQRELEDLFVRLEQLVVTNRVTDESRFCEQCGKELGEFSGGKGDRGGHEPRRLSESDLAALCCLAGNQTREILRRYVAIHDDLFGRSRLRTLFARADYGRHREELQSLVSELGKIASVATALERLVEGSSRLKEFIGTLKEYLSADEHAPSLRTAIVQLRYICMRMFAKIEGGEAYSWGEFRLNRKTYEWAVERCTRKGEHLSALSADISQQLIADEIANEIANL